MSVFNHGGLSIFTDIQAVATTYIDDIAIKLGTGGTVSLLFETADANASLLALVFPEGGAVDVPVFALGDASILNVDMGFFNGITEPTLAVINDAADAYVSLDAGDDAVAGSKGLYFKTAADEDIEIINCSPTGTPRVYWDESEDKIRSTKGWYWDAGCRIDGHIGVTVAIDSENGITVNESFTNPASHSRGGQFINKSAFTSASTALVTEGGELEGYCLGTNTQNWTTGVGLRGSDSEVFTVTGGTGTITGAASAFTYSEISGATVTDLAGLWISDDGGSGTITTQYGVYIPALTRGGTIYAIYTGGTAQSYFGGNVQTGTLGVRTAPNATYDILCGRTVANAAYVGLMVNPTISYSTANSGNVGQGIYGALYINSSNNKNWTAAVGVINIHAALEIQTGATGVITGATGYYHEATIAAMTITNLYGAYIADATGAGTVTNQYGVYINTMTKGGTLNYALYCVGASVGIFAALPTSNPAVAGKWWANAGVVTVSAG